MNTTVEILMDLVDLNCLFYSVHILSLVEILMDLVDLNMVFDNLAEMQDQSRSL